MLRITTKSDPGVMILENSISSKSRQKTKKFTLSKTTALPKPPAQHEQMNNWDYCNPANFEDPLPQPYRFINRCLNELILNKVYEQVFDIEKYKNNSNYEGRVKEIVSSGSFDIEGVSCLAHSETNPYNHLLAGDYYGTVYLLDMAKKVQITKISVVPGKRVIHISTNTTTDEDLITTFAVICRGDPNIHIYRYKNGESKIFKSFTIPFLKKGEILDKNTSISQFPYQCKLSTESKFLVASLYNGNIEIYCIPEPQFSLPNIANLEKRPSMKNISLANRSSEQTKPLTPVINLDNPATEISEAFYVIPLKAPAKKKTYEETLNAFIMTVEKKAVEEPTDPKALPKDKKPANPPPDPKKPGANASKQEPSKEISSDFEGNEIQFLGETLRNDKEADVSDDFKLPEHRAEFFFTSEKLVLPTETRSFCKMKEFTMTNGVAVVWIGQKTVDFHRISAVTKENLPNYLQLSLRAVTAASTNSQEEAPKVLPSLIKKEEPGKKAPPQAQPPLPNTEKKAPTETKPQDQAPTFEKKLFKSFEVLYNLTIAAINRSSTFLAVGLLDGSVFIYDILLQQEHCYLDKHLSEVTNMGFFEDWKLVSGSADGTVHSYNLKECTLEMKRTNIFKPEGLAIKALEISGKGLAIALDNRFNVRVYDLFHQEKIMKLMPISILDESKKQWVLWPKPVISAQKDQFCLTVNIIDQEGTEATQPLCKEFKKNGKILIFRIYDSLLNIFPALTNLSRKGVLRDKILNAFQKLSLEELKNPQFDIPVFPVQETRSKTTLAIQSKNFKALPVIIENEGPTKSQKSNKFPLTQTKKIEEVKPVKETEIKKKDSNTSMTFSKLHTKESEVNSSIDLSSSFKTIPNLPSLKTAAKSKKTEKSEGLTKDALHPENILNEIKKLPPPELYHPLKDPIQQTIGFNRDKAIRLEKMEKTYAKINSDLEIQEVKNNLRKKKEMLKNTMK